MDYNVKHIPYSIVYSKRKTLAIEIKPEGVLVRAPEGMKKREINAFLLEKRNWIEKHLAKMEERTDAIKELPTFEMEELKEMAKKAKIILSEKVKKYASILGVTYGNITIRNQRSRWGSCSSKGNLNFNCLLVLFPDEVIDYVVVHELCHRIHMNHSADFYREVEGVFPEYKKCRQWLKENGGLYLSRIQ